ncbi:14-3-3-like protein [Octopus sinensis]|uniref:14-3-3-like protein n=1 Tax=Octopus sinensis TaxID=2607531 RepID=A0A6P7TUS2_9MOLL|nr:14-3-3-like protein [Octopus sinensis]
MIKVTPIGRGLKILSKYFNRPGNPAHTTPNLRPGKPRRGPPSTRVLSHSVPPTLISRTGDYERYMAEVAPDEEVKLINATKSEDAYKKALEIAKGLNPSEASYLGLCLNYSVFLYEILGQTKRATSLAKEAFDSAVEPMSSMQGQSTAKGIFHQIRRNLIVWNSESGEGDTNLDGDS